METLPLIKHIEELFKENEKFSDNDGKLFIPKILESIDKIDSELIKLLITDETAKKHFFTQIEEAFILKQNDLIEFFTMNEYFNHSYTSYTNKIGLIKKDNFIKKFDDVVLAFPHKDCVLEGGQTKEDDKKNEIFYNQIISKDEIDRLFEPKVLTNIKKYTKDEVIENPEITVDDNLIIKGNNLLALHSLKKKYTGKVKLIYIDPPYNTENDSFKYNDNFNHSTWLTFMKNRFEIAKELLKEDGVIFVSLDDKEAHYCKVLMDEVFKRDNFIADICHKARASVSNDKIISPSHNHILLYAKDERKVFKNKHKFGIKKELKGFNLSDDNGNYKLVPVDGPGGASKGNPYYEFLGIENYWRFSKETMQEMYDKGLIVKNGKTLSQKYYESKAKLSKQTVTTWWDNGYLTSTATSQLKELMGDKVFNNPKHVNLLKMICELWTEDNDIILDYHAGSGTTAHAVLKLNKEDKKNRKFILVEQMDYIDSVTSSRVKKVLEQEELNEHYIYLELKEISTFEKSEIAKLNRNMQYLPISEIDDEEYGISEEEKTINKKFYGLDNE